MPLATYSGDSMEKDNSRARSQDHELVDQMIHVVDAAMRETNRAIGLNRNATSEMMDVLEQLRDLPGTGKEESPEIPAEHLEKIMQILQVEDLSSQALFESVGALEQIRAGLEALVSIDAQTETTRYNLAKWRQSYRKDHQEDLQEGSLELFDHPDTGD